MSSPLKNPVVVVPIPTLLIDNIPAAISDTLQCWLADHNTSTWTTEVDDSLHSKMYELATGSGLLLKGSESLI